MLLEGMSQHARDRVVLPSISEGFTSPGACAFIRCNSHVLPGFEFHTSLFGPDLTLTRAEQADAKGVLAARCVFRVQVDTKLDGLVVKLRRIRKVYVFACPRIAVVRSLQDIVISRHSAGFTFTAATGSAAGAVAVPLFTGTPDLDVQIRPRVPFQAEVELVSLAPQCA